MWPLPPTAPDGWARWLQIDDPVDLYYDGGWWEVQLMKLPSADAAAAADAAGLGANIADGYGVRSPRYGDEHTVGTERLRPRWRHTMKKTYVKPLQPSDEGAPSAASSRGKGALAKSLTSYHIFETWRGFQKDALRNRIVATLSKFQPT